MGFRRSETILASALLGAQQPSSNPLEVGSYSITLQRMLYSYSTPTIILCFLVFIALISYFTISDSQVVIKRQFVAKWSVRGVVKRKAFRERLFRKR